MSNRSWFPRSGLGRKMFTSYMLTTFVPLLIVNAVSLVQLSTDIRRAREEQITTELRSLRETISLVLYDLYYGLDALASEPQLREFLETSHTGIVPFYLSFHDTVRPVFSRYLTFSRAVDGVSVLTTNEVITDFARSLALTDVITDNSLSEFNLAGQTIIMRERTVPGPGRTTTPRPVFVRRVVAPFSDYTHAVALTLNTAYLRQSIGWFALNSDVRLVSPTGVGVASFSLNERSSSREQTPVLYSLAFVVPGTTDSWTLEARVFDVPRVALVGSYVVYLILGFIVILAASFSKNLIFSRHVSSRLAELKLHSERTGDMQYEALPDDGEDDEISALRNTMNTMTHRIKKLVEEVLESQVREHKLEAEQRRAELHALQSRVNPHMFYNTLETIRMRSIVKKEHETAEILNQLALLFRRSYNWKDEFTSVERELRFVGYLVSVHRYRFGDRIHYIENVDAEAFEVQVPKFCIQTVAENALLHGIEPVGGGVIELRCEIHQATMTVTVRDNGAGITPEVIDTLRRQMDAHTIRNEHVGLTNVAARFAMHYQEGAGIAIESTPGHGTTVTLRIPLVGTP